MRQETPGLLFFGKPEIGEREIEAVVRVLQSGWLSKGELCGEFERAIASRSGTRNGVFLNSCTAALHLSLLAHDIGPGDTVLVPALTFVATAQAAEICGARVALCDVDPITMNLTAETVRSAMTQDVKACIGVHFGGRAFDIDGVRKAVANAPLIEDAAHALGAIDRLGRPVGASGNLVCFSFYPNKVLTTGEGGMIVLNDDALATHLRSVAQHGLSFGAWQTFSGRSTARPMTTAAGYKYHSTDLNAAIGLAQLERFDQFARRRRAIAELYRELLQHEERLELPASEAGMERSSNHLFAVRLRRNFIKVERDEVLVRLRDAGILASVHYEPIHTQPYFAERYGWRPEDFPVALEISRSTLSLPNHPSLTDDDIRRISGALLASID